MMSTTDLERFRTALVSLRSRLTGDVSHLKEETLRERAGAQGTSLSPAADVADQGNDLYEYEFNLSLLHNQEQTLAEIRDALDRIDSGSYGKCEECHEAISRARLQALPYTRFCVSCARKLQ
jgi:RNA polymerase-binding transcription factor DksA